MLFICDVLNCTPKEFYGILIFFCLGFLGMVVHWAKKWLRDQTDCNLFCYLFVSNGRYTASSVMTYFAVMAAILAIGKIDYTTAQSLSISFLAGYMIDSALNKDVSE